MSRVATLVLNRNNPEQTDAICDSIESFNTGNVDIFVIESGSDQKRLSRRCCYWANWDEANRNGLRYARGFNHGLSELYKERKLARYDYIFLLCNDVELDAPIIPILVEEMERHPQLGILSPCDKNWGERELIGENSTRYCWHVNHVAWMMRTEMIQALMTRESPDHMNFLYDGSNFRGYLADLEIVIKGYIQEFGTAITTKAFFTENTALLKERAELMKTEVFDVNQRLVIEEGEKWIFRKYGFTSRHQMHLYAKLFYDRFFQLNPDIDPYRL